MENVFFRLNETEYLTHLFFGLYVVKEPFKWLEDKLNVWMQTMLQNRK